MRQIAMALVCALMLAACGGTGTPEEDDGTSQPAETTTPADTSESTAPEVTEAPADTADPGEVGGITLTVGDETWEFVGSQCAFYNAEPGEDGSEWNVSKKDGDLQVYISFDDFVGPSVKINDVVNEGVLSWEAEGDGAVVIQVDGNKITAEGTFTDKATGQPAQQGTLTATCTSWYDGR